MTAPSNDYWAQRAILREQEAYAKGLDLTNLLYKQYQSAARDIRKQISDFYTKYARKNGLQYEDAVKLLNRQELQTWRAGLGDYVEAIAMQTDPRVKAAMTASLDALSTNSQVTRLMALEAEVQATISSLHTKAAAELQKEFGTVLEDGYYKKMYDLQNRVGYQFQSVGIDRQMVENITSYPWSGAAFSARLWQNMSTLTFNLRQTMTQGIIQGKSIAQMSKEMADKMGSSYKAAERLVRTENTHFNAEADRLVYQEAHIDQYEFIATLDHRTSAVCAGLDGQTFEVAKAETGINYPPMHPNCRSTTVEYDPEEAQDWAAIGEPMPKRITYEDWKKEQIGLYGEDGFKSRQNMVKNAESDKIQYDRNKEILGKNAPKSFADFQQLKYNDSNTWDSFKAYTRSIKSGELAPLADFTLYQDARKSIESTLIGLTTKNDIKVNSYSDHFAARIIGSVEQRRSGVSIDVVKETLLNPIRVDEPRLNKKYVSQRLWSDNAIVTINPETGVLIQTNPRRKRKNV